MEAVQEDALHKIVRHTKRECASLLRAGLSVPLLLLWSNAAVAHHLVTVDLVAILVGEATHAVVAGMTVARAQAHQLAAAAITRRWT